MRHTWKQNIPSTYPTPKTFSGTQPARLAWQNFRESGSLNKTNSHILPLSSSFLVYLISPFSLHQHQQHQQQQQRWHTGHLISRVPRPLIARTHTKIPSLVPQGAFANRKPLMRARERASANNTRQLVHSSCSRRRRLFSSFPFRSLASRQCREREREREREIEMQRLLYTIPRSFATLRAR